MKSQGDMSEAQIVRQHFKLNVMSLTIFGMCHLKSINVREGLRNYYIKYGDSDSERSYAKFLKKNHWLYQDDIEMLQENSYMVVKINDNADVCVQIKTVPAPRKQSSSFENQFALTKKEMPLWFVIT